MRACVSHVDDRRPRVRSKPTCRGGCSDRFAPRAGAGMTASAAAARGAFCSRSVATLSSGATRRAASPAARGGADGFRLSRRPTSPPRLRATPQLRANVTTTRGSGCRAATCAARPRDFIGPPQAAAGFLSGRSRTRLRRRSPDRQFKHASAHFRARDCQQRAATFRPGSARPKPFSGSNDDADAIAAMEQVLAFDPQRDGDPRASRPRAVAPGAGADRDRPARARGRQARRGAHQLAARAAVLSPASPMIFLELAQTEWPRRRAGQRGDARAQGDRSRSARRGRR